MAKKKKERAKKLLLKAKLDKMKRRAEGNIIEINNIFSLKKKRIIKKGAQDGGASLNG